MASSITVERRVDTLAFAQKLANNGFTVYMTDCWGGAYLQFNFEGNAGYMGNSDFDGPKFSTVNKPSRECGTGFQFADNQGMSIETAKRCCTCVAPHWASSADRAAATKSRYRDLIDWQENLWRSDDAILVEPTKGTK